AAANAHSLLQYLPASLPPPETRRCTTFLQCSHSTVLGLCGLRTYRLRSPVWKRSPHLGEQNLRFALLGSPVVLLMRGMMTPPHWAHVQFLSAMTRSLSDPLWSGPHRCSTTFAARFVCALLSYTSAPPRSLRFFQRLATVARLRNRP